MRLIEQPSNRVWAASVVQDASSWCSWWRPAIAQVATLLVFSFLFGLLLRSGCLHPPPPLERPDPGTPRAQYCAAVNGHAPWLLVTAPPLALLALWHLLPIARRWHGLGWLIVLVLALALLADATLANTLRAIVAIPGLTK